LRLRHGRGSEWREHGKGGEQPARERQARHGATPYGERIKAVMPAAWRRRASP
jgi:hypothetical protein